MWIVLAAMGAVALGNLVKGVTGFGSAIVAIPLVSLVTSPTEAMVWVAATDVVTGAWLATDARRDLRWRPLVAMVVPLFASQWLATDLLSWLPEQTSRQVIAGLVAVLALGVLWRPVRREGTKDGDPESAPALAWAVVAGAGAGMTSGLAGMPGPPLVAWVRRHLSDAEGRALLLAVFVPSAIALVSMLVGKGLVGPDRLPAVALLVPAGLTGGWLGRRLARRVSPVAFGRMVGVVLMVAAVGLASGR